MCLQFSIFRRANNSTQKYHIVHIPGGLISYAKCEVVEIRRNLKYAIGVSLSNKRERSLVV